MNPEFEKKHFTHILWLRDSAEEITGQPCEESYKELQISKVGYCL